MIAVIAGVLLSLVLILLARTRGPAGAIRIYALGLVVTALLYVLLAVMGGASASYLALEGVGVLIFASAAWIGVRGWVKVLALGWVLHVAWDLLLHLQGSASEYTPWWWPWFCLSFDLIIAAAVLLEERRLDGEPLRGGPVGLL